MLGGVFLAANDAALAMSDKICHGLVVAGVPVGGLSVRDAERELAIALKRRQDRPLTVLQEGETRWDIPWSVVQGTTDAATLSRQAYQAGRTGNLLQRIHDQYMIKNGVMIISLGLNADKEKLRTIVMSASRAVDRLPVNATIIETVNGVEIRQDKSGIKTQIAVTVQNLINAIENGNFEPVELVTEETPPMIGSKDLQGINGILAAFSTVFDAGDENRSRNIEIAAKALDECLIKPGSIFSFNDRVGLRTPEKGYKQALTLTSEGPVMDWGGGVCQVSTTLYNAALLADLSVVERSAHYQPPNYVPLGQDATVADGQIDLKLKNMRAHSVFVKGAVNDGKMEVRIYGKQDKAAPTVRIESAERTVHISQTIIKQDPSLPLGQEIVESPGSNGFDVTVYRVKYAGSRELSREKISVDEFAGSDRIVRVGTQSAGSRNTK